MLRCFRISQKLDYPEPPYGFRAVSLEACYQYPGFSSNKPVSDDSLKSWQAWPGQWHNEAQHIPCSILSKKSRHVSGSKESVLSDRQPFKARPRRQRLQKYVYILLTVPTIYLSSSGQPSPPSSVASFVFSSGGSSSSRSPNSSQASSTGSPEAVHLGNQRQPRIQVSSLLADPYTRTYHLEIVQHPQKTAEFRHSNLSRLPLTPPIIARLTVRDSSGNAVVPEAELPFLIAHLSLFSDDGLTALDMGSSIGGGRAPPLLYGNLVSSIDQLEDLQGNMGLFFVFPDVSIRWRGRFQLGITVMKISRSDPSGAMGIADHGVVLAETRTRSFDVLPHSQYSAVPRTRLTTSFLRQGARMFTFMSQNI